MRLLVLNLFLQTFLIWTIVGTRCVSSFTTGNLPAQSITPTIPSGDSTRTYSSYGRGAEIWPECNEEPIKLSESFPNGQIPGVVAERLQNPLSDDTQKWGLTPLETLPALIILGVLLRGLVAPLDVMATFSLSGYLTILHRLGRSVRADGITPSVPSLPPQGFVPDQYTYPLGRAFTFSRGYDIWLRVGGLLGLWAPSMLILKQILSKSTLTVAKLGLVARPLFYSCSQAMSEAVLRRIMAPLPLQILLPTMYNCMRLIPIWMWAAGADRGLSRILGGMNLVYWTANLFGFLLPIAVMRYLRTHFLCIEAEAVTTREGFEHTVGLLVKP